MKIISGNLKGKTIIENQHSNFRPTAGRTKESIVSVLSSGQFINSKTNEAVLKEAIILDLFGGSGALTFEAISRGARKGIIIENNFHNSKIIELNSKKLGIHSQIQILKCDATNLPRAPVSIEKKCAVVFIDPPYNKNLIAKAVSALSITNWLVDGALLVIESHIKEHYNLSSNYILIFSRQYGKTVLNIYRYSILEAKK